MQGKIGKIEAKKSLGQHFLNNTRVPALMAVACMVGRGDTVLEIGPGTGVLTKELLQRGAKVVAIETDMRAVESLQETFAEEIMAQKLVISHSDIRTIDVKALGLRPRAYKIVANIPYYLSGLLFRLCLESDTQPSDLVFLVQREVAERITKDKKESLLSLSVKVFGTPKYIKTVGKGNFTPPPKVDSAVIAVLGISDELLEQAQVPREDFFYLIHQGFKSKRKQLLGNLADTIPRETLTHIFSTAGIPLTVRGEDLTLKKWLELCSAILVHIPSYRNTQS